MNKKLVIMIGALVLALVASVGTFAATYLTAGATVGAASGGADFVSSNVAAGQPDWNSLLPHTEVGQEILRPNAPGDSTGLPGQFPNYGAHWQKVMEAPPDESATTVFATITSMRLDLYNLSDHGMGNGTINGVTVFFRITGTGSATAYAQGAMRTGGNTYLGPEETQAGGIFSTRSYQWVSNPATLQPWTWSDIDALQAGVQMRRSGNGEATCTQVYVLIDYTTLPIISGATPAGNLFSVAPAAGYNGDMLLKVYLTNTGAVQKAYKYLNVKVYVAGSVEAGHTPNYQLLSLENGVVLFNILGGTAPSYTVQATGGSYAVISGNSANWAPGWSITPELFLEATSK